MEILTEKLRRMQYFMQQANRLKMHTKLQYRGDIKGTAPHQLEGRTKTFSLTDPELVKISQDVTERISKIAKETLKDRKNDNYIQNLCGKSSLQIIQGQQDRTECQMHALH